MQSLQDATVDFEIIQGDDETFEITFKDENALPINITGYTVFFTLKKKLDSDATDDEASIKVSVTSHTDAVNGETSVSLTNDQTSALEARRYYYDFQLKDTSNKIASTKYGVCEVIPDVTNRES